MFRDVVVPLDGSQEAEAAVAPGTTLARGLGATLRLVQATFDADAVGPPERAREYLEFVAGDVAAADRALAVVVEVVTGVTPADALHDALAGRPEQLVCMSTQGHGWIGEAVLGRVGTRLVRAVNGPLVLVGPACHQWEPLRGRDIVVVLDGSPVAELILPAVFGLAGTLGMAVRLMRVAHPDALATGMDALEEAYVHAVAQRWDGAGVSCDIVFDEHAERAIVEYVAKIAAPLVAMGIRGYNHRGASTLHSVAAATIRQSPCPVLVQYTAEA